MKFYRYKFQIMDESWQDVRVRLYVYSMVKETPKGYWISMYPESKKWIPKQSKKRFAYPTKKEAMINFIKRTERHKRILEARSDVATRALSEAEILFNKLQ